jgi:hypothetical protein
MSAPVDHGPSTASLDAVVAVLDGMERIYPAGSAEYDGETFTLSAAAAAGPHGKAISGLIVYLDHLLRPGHELATDVRVSFEPTEVGPETGGSSNPLLSADDPKVAAPDVIVADENAINEATGSYPIPADAVHLIIEVLSPSTKRYDLGWKLDAARSAGIDYWVVHSSTEIGQRWHQIDVRRFSSSPIYVAPS